MSSTIVHKTIELAKDKTMMDSYKDFYDGKGYFLTTNPRLDGAKEKPKMFSKSNFESWWRELHYSQRKYLLLKSGVEETDIKYENILKTYEK